MTISFSSFYFAFKTRDSSIYFHENVNYQKYEIQPSINVVNDVNYRGKTVTLLSFTLFNMLSRK